MKKILCFITVSIILASIATSTFAQNSIIMSSVKKDISFSTWHKFAESSSVVFYYQYVDCGPISFILLKVDNNNDGAVNVGWDYELVNNGKTIQIGPDDIHVSLNINSKQSLYGECDYAKNKSLRVFVSEPNQPRLTAINLLNVKVSSTK
jgi:hypothetical protein